MVLFINYDGTIVYTQPSAMYQQSTVGELLVVAPYDENMTATVAFTLPNGIVTRDYPFTYRRHVNLTKEGGIVFAGNAWSIDIPAEVTEEYGTVSGSIKFYLPNGKRKPTSQFSFSVGAGVPSELPDVPTQTVYEDILSLISSLIERQEMGVLPARSFKEWSNAVTYSAGEITAFLVEYQPTPSEYVKYYAFVRSLINNNTNHTPFVGGELQTQYWTLVSDAFSRDQYAIDIEYYDEKIDDIERTLDGQDEQISALNSRVASAETAIGSLSTRIDQTAEQLQDDINFVSGEQLRTAGELRLLQSVVAEQGTHLEEVESLIPETTSDVNKLVNQGQLTTAIRENAGNFRGTFADWASVPSSSQYYRADVYGFRVPTVNDDMSVRDASDYHGEEIMTKSGATAGKYLDALGVEHTNADFSISRFIELPHDADRNIILTVNTAFTSWTRVHAYTGAGQWISEVVAVNNDGDNQAKEKFAELPENAVYIRVSYPTTATVSARTAQLVGSWRFIYTGTWATNGKAGWEPKEQISTTTLTEAQMEAVNSGITADKVAQYDQIVGSAPVLYVYDIDNNALTVGGLTPTDEELQNALKSGKLRCRAYSVDRSLFVDLSGYLSAETVGEEVLLVGKLSASVKGATAVNIYTLSIVFADGGGRTLNFSVDEISGVVTDVTVGGVSVVDENGTAVIPSATVNAPGVVVGDGAHGTQTSQGYVQIYQATETVLNNRKQTSYLGYRQPITNNNLDTAVKLAMGDGKGSAWTSAEQTNAQERIGVDDEKSATAFNFGNADVTYNLAPKTYKNANAHYTIDLSPATSATRTVTISFDGYNTASANSYDVDYHLIIKTGATVPMVVFNDVDNWLEDPVLEPNSVYEYIACAFGVSLFLKVA